MSASFQQAGSWKVTCAATATFSDSDGNTWTGLGTADVTLTVAPAGCSVTAQSPAICAGAVPTALHQTLLTAVQTDGAGAAQAGVSVTFVTTDGSLSTSMATTDADGMARTVLTSSTSASDPAAQPPVTYTATVTATDSSGSATTPVEFQATSVGLYTDTINIPANGVSTLNAQVTWNGAAVPMHTVNWRISQIWDNQGNLVYSGQGMVPPGYGTLTVTQSTTDPYGYATASLQAGTQPGTMEVEASDGNVQKKPAAGPPSARRTLNEGMELAIIGLDEGQKGVNGDYVTTNKRGGDWHYVSPKQAGAVVRLNALTASGVDFNTVFVWMGGDLVPGGAANQLQVPRDLAGKYEIKVARRVGGAVVDRMNVWIVWASLTADSKQPIQGILVRNQPIQPKVGARQPGVVAVSWWFTQWQISPASIYYQAGDIPNLTGDKTRDVPGADQKHFASGTLLARGADRRWDASRQGRVRFLSPTVGTNDMPAVTGPVFDNLPNANLVTVNYPADDTIGNDDDSTDFQDNNPYSAAETGFTPLVFGARPYKNPIGSISTFDQPTVPQFITAAGANGDTVEMRFQAREFARLQIGNSGAANYKNWYRISDFALWRHHALFKKVDGAWVDNGSVSDKTNDGW